MHRLIPSGFSSGGTVLGAIAEDDAMMADIALLDAATNDRILGEQFGLSGIGPFELVYGIPNAHIVRAAFLHSSLFGSRFNNATRGAWYAAVELETSVAEVSYHKAKHLEEIVVSGLPLAKPDRESSDYDDWQADFDAGFHALEPIQSYAAYLEAEPVPQCYRASQQLAKELLEGGSNGILYSSVRRKSGQCLACFRPALVHSPRQAGHYRLTLVLVNGAYETEVTLADRL